MLFKFTIVLLILNGIQALYADAKVVNINLYLTPQLAKEADVQTRITEAMAVVQKIYDDAQLTQPLLFQANGIAALPDSATSLVGTDVESTFQKFSTGWQTVLANTTEVDIAVLFAHFTPSTQGATAVGVGNVGTVCQMSSKGGAVVDAGQGMTTVNTVDMTSLPQSIKINLRISLEGLLHMSLLIYLTLSTM
jgi:hypothetical protein